MSGFHSNAHTDYSQQTALVHRVVFVNGKAMKIEDVLRDPKLSRVLSDEGPLRLLRHPGVVPPPAIAVAGVPRGALDDDEFEDADDDGDPMEEFVDDLEEDADLLSLATEGGGDPREIDQVRLEAAAAREAENLEQIEEPAEGELLEEELLDDDGAGETDDDEELLE